MRTKRYSIVTGLVLILSLLVSSLLNPGSANAATDKVKPTISGATNSVAYLNHSFDPRKGVAAKDNVDGNITSIIKITGKVNTKKLGKYTLTYKVTDSAKNTCTVKRVITVIKDTTNPKITGVSNKTIYMGYSFNPKTGVKAIDNAAGNLTSKIKVSGKVNTKKVGKYKITYTVTDKAKNTSKVTRTITVKKDTTKPKITGASNVTINYGSSFDYKKGVKATDNLDGSITSKLKISGTVNTKKIGTYKLTYMVKDKTGNQATVTRTVKVVDKVSPKITGANNITINYGSSFDPMKGIKATDYIDGTITNRVKITGTVNTDKIGTYKLTYTVKDKSGNKATVTRTVKIIDRVSNKPDLRLDKFDYSDVNANFSLVNHHNVTVDVEAIKVYNKVGSMVQEYSKGDLRDLGVETTILPSKRMHMELTFAAYNNLIDDGGKIVIFAGPSGGNIYKYILSKKPDLRLVGSAGDVNGHLSYLSFSVMNYDNVPIDVKTVKIYNSAGFLVQTYAKKDLRNMGVKTNILPSEYMYMPMVFENNSGTFLRGRIVILAGLSGCYHHEYVFSI